MALPSSTGRDLRYLGGLGLLLVLAAMLRLHDLGGQAFDSDELYAVRIPATSWKQLAAVLGRAAFHEPHPPLSSLTFAVWSALVGTGEVAIRSLPAVVGILGVALLAGVGRRIAGPGAGLAAAAFLAVNPLQVAYAQEARPYALAVTLVVAAHLFFLRSLAAERPRDRAMYALLLAAAAYTHYFALIAVLPHGLAALWIARTGDPGPRAAARETLLAFAAGMATFLAWAPALLFQLSYGPQGPGTGTFRLRSVRQVGSMAAEVSGVGSAWPLLLATAASIALVAVAFRAREPLAVLARDGGEPPPLTRRVGVVALLAALPAALLLRLAAERAAPAAREILVAYGYGPDAIAGELRAITRFSLSVPVALAAVGAILLFWRGLAAWLDRVGRGARGRPPTRGALLAFLLLVPLLAVALLGLLGAAIFSSRNLLLFQPALALALGCGAAAVARAPRGRLLLPVMLVSVGAAALQYGPISWLVGLPGTEMGKRAAPWRELASTLSPAARGPGLLLADVPNTNPALFYLAHHGVRRVTGPAELASLPLPPGLRFVHLTGDRGSEAVLAALARRRPLKPRIRVDALLVYEVGPQAGGPEPGVKIAPRRGAPPPTPTPQQGGFPP